MQFVGRILGAVAVIGLLAGPAAAQKGPANIPEQQKTDPWGTVRSDSAPPKAAAKAPQAKPKAKSAEGAPK